jgi:hypothetical protein
MQAILALAFVFSSFFSGAQAPTVSQVTTEYSAFAKIGAERNTETKKKLILNFEKTFPKSNRLPELFMNLSRTLVAGSDFTNGQQYAEKAVAAVRRLKSEYAAAGEHDSEQQQWLNSLDASTAKNLAWVKQMVAWQQQQVRSSVLGKR